jgi:hypothetical protein
MIRLNDNRARARRRGRSVARAVIAAASAAVLAAGCAEEKVPLTPAEQAAKDRAECIAIAIDQTGFDPTTAEAPVKTLSSTHERGGDVMGSGSIAKGAVGGAAGGAIVGAIAGDTGTGAAIGAAAGGLFGGLKRRSHTKEMVTTTRPNPAYQEYEANKASYRQTLDTCLALRKRGE